MARNAKGQFLPGYDKDRRLFSQADRQRGYHNAPQRIKNRIRGLYKGGKIKKTGETTYPELEF